MAVVNYSATRWFYLQKFQHLATQERIEIIDDAWTKRKKPVPEFVEICDLAENFTDFCFWTRKKVARCIVCGIRYRDSDFVRLVANEFYQPRIYEEDKEFIARFDAYCTFSTPRVLHLVK